MAEAKRDLVRARSRRGRRLLVLFAGFSPGMPTPSAMLNPRILHLSRSPHPEREWRSGELETALVLAKRPDPVRRAVARRLPPVWIDFQRALKRGARRFEQIAPGGLGYFGWPAAARATTANRALKLRGRLIARELLGSGFELRHSRGGRPKPARPRARRPGR